jgi:PhzF family phenazine biosynthesis protein
MPSLPLYQVDAFTDRPFAGNPAAVCPLDAWLPDATMQAIAAENNLSETAFFVRRADGDFDLRWFTPALEVDLCGHATLATAFVMFERLEPARARVRFHTKSGALDVTRDGARLVLDFPARAPREVDTPPGLAEALGARPASVVRARDPIALFERAEQVRALAPDMRAIAALPDVFAVCATAPGTGQDDDVDFVSRFFAPAEGLPEDPVTGSAHSSLVPLWVGRTGRTQLRARQVSARGGDLWCELAGNRVRMAGHAVLVVEATLYF